MYCVNCGEALGENESGCTKCKTVNALGKKDVVSYDYVTVEANQKNVNEVVDCYETLGWQLSEKKERYPFGATLSFKRDRKTKNKEQLNRLRLKLDDAVNGIAVCESKKTCSATVAAGIIGMLGALIFGGGMSMCLLLTGIAYLTVGIALGVVGVGVCALGYLAYRKISAKKTLVMNSMIDHKRDEISTLCEDAQKFLA